MNQIHSRSLFSTVFPLHIYFLNTTTHTRSTPTGYVLRLPSLIFPFLPLFLLASPLFQHCQTFASTVHLSSLRRKQQEEKREDI